MFGIINLMHVSKKFERLLEAYRRPDGGQWTGQQLDEATDGVVPRSYITNLRKGRIESPGYEKMAAIAKAMGFPPGAWFEESVGDSMAAGPGYEGLDLAGRVKHLFGVIKNPSTDEPYTNADVARATLGDLSEKDVEGIRTGATPDPTVSQVTALADVFGVEPSYLLDRLAPVFDRELVEALRDGAVRDATREISRLPERERGMVLGIVRQFGSAGEANARQHSRGTA